MYACATCSESSVSSSSTTGRQRTQRQWRRLRRNDSMRWRWMYPRILATYIQQGNEGHVLQRNNAPLVMTTSMSVDLTLYLDGGLLPLLQGVDPAEELLEREQLLVDAAHDAVHREGVCAQRGGRGGRPRRQVRVRVVVLLELDPPALTRWPRRRRRRRGCFVDGCIPNLGRRTAPGVRHMQCLQLLRYNIQCESRYSTTERIRSCCIWVPSLCVAATCSSSSETPSRGDYLRLQS